MRYEFQLGNRYNTKQVTSLGFTPNKIIVLNNTSNPVFIRRGNPSIPTATYYDYVVPGATATIPATNVALPTSVREFGFFLPLTPALSDPLQTVTVILEGDGTLSNDFFEFRLDAGTPKLSIEVPFQPSQVFIYNPSDGTLLMSAGSLRQPTDLDQADIIITPRNYTIFTPWQGYDYGVFLKNVTAWQCVIFFAKGEGFTDYPRFMDYPNMTYPGNSFALNPLPNPNVVASFTFTLIGS